MTIIIRESKPGSTYRWKHFQVITDNRVAIVEMTPALYGWNIHEVTIQGAYEWNGMTEASILAFKGNDEYARVATDADLGGFFKEKLLAAAGVL